MLEYASHPIARQENRKGRELQRKTALDDCHRDDGCKCPVGKLKMLREIWLISGTRSEKAHVVYRLSDENTSDIRQEDGRKQGTRSTGDNRLSKHLARMLQAFG